METSEQEDLVKELEMLSLEQDDSLIEKQRVVMQKETTMFNNLDKELAQFQKELDQLSENEEESKQEQTNQKRLEALLY